MSASRRLAIVTPSYAADFDRCRLLCESMDALADTPYRHYILVADHDLDLFAPLAGPDRVVIPDAEVLPQWMKAVRRPFDSKGRYVWISTELRRQIRPLSGWHVQQLRKLAVAKLVDEDVIVMADSDSVFLRPFGMADFTKGDAVRLYRRPGAITATANVAYDHAAWTRNAAAVLGLPAPPFPADDHINNLVSWRRAHALACLARIEAIGAAPVEQVLGRSAMFSEYQIYGAFAAGPLGMTGHFDSADALSHTYWVGDALDHARLDDFVAEMEPHQIALCIQSFTGTSVELIRRIVRAAKPAAVHM
jgi:hypothetical protein